MGFRSSGIRIPPLTLDENLISAYDETRNFPGINGTTRLGIHLRHGTLSVRHAVKKAFELNATWLNEVERWFGLITQRATRRGSFRTVRELARRIDTFVTRYNRTATPFRWTATADSILATAARIAKVINGTQD